MAQDAEEALDNAIVDLLNIIKKLAAIAPDLPAIVEGHLAEAIQNLRIALIASRDYREQTYREG